MMNIMQMLNQAKQGQQPLDPNDSRAHQEPIAAAMRSMMKIIEYEKRILPPNVFNEMVDALKDNIVIALNNVKAPVIPPMTDVVSVNGEPVNIASSS